MLNKELDRRFKHMTKKMNESIKNNSEFYYYQGQRDALGEFAEWTEDFNIDEYEALENWMKERNFDSITPSKRQIVKHFVEELFEMCGYDKPTTKLYTDNFMNTMVHDELLTENAMVDAMCDFKIFAINDLYSMGYSPACCHQETFLEINSRKGSYDKEQGKFIKQVIGDEYVARYDLCKR